MPNINALMVNANGKFFVISYPPVCGSLRNHFSTLLLVVGLINIIFAAEIDYVSILHVLERPNAFV